MTQMSYRRNAIFSGTYCQLLGIDYKKHDETPEFTVYGAWYSVV